MSVIRYRYYALFRGLLNDYDEYESDIDMGELDSQAYSLQSDLDRLQPYRDPKLNVDYLGITGEVEMLFNFKITWMDRDSDIEIFLDDVQEVIENSMDLLITERQGLGFRQEA